ncbi:MAG: aminotransferase class I/II-fold pyridoxal phosphate-dependent enzyme, partial [Acidimicrobiales bacterium]
SPPMRRPQDITRSLPAPGEHGGDGAALARVLGVAVEEILDLSASMNPFAPDPSVVVGRHLGALGRYPDPTRARLALARTMDVDPDCLVLTNGGSQAIAVVAEELGRGWAEEADFALYRRHLGVMDRSGPQFRSNPNNPTGALAPPGATAGVWDEAFWPLATGTWTRGDVSTGAIVVGSLTKLLSCPGLRLGYILAPHAGLARCLAHRLAQWSVNSLACEALPEMLDGVDLDVWAAGITRLREAMVHELRSRKMAVRDSMANYLLVDGVPGLRLRLAPHGIMVRDCASFGLAGSARLAVTGPDGLARLVAALDASEATEPAAPVDGAPPVDPVEALGGPAEVATPIEAADATGVIA